QKRRSFLGFLREASGKEEGSGWQNDDVMVLANMANEAVMVNNLNTEKFGFYTSTVVLFDKDHNKLTESVRLVRKAIEDRGFKTYSEDINLVEAYLGSLPAVDYANIRLPILSTNNVADLMPATSIWSGLERNPSQIFADLGINNPPLMYTVTDGATPFRLSLHVNDVGHTIVLGPTGSGKSTLLNLIAAQHLRYRNAKVFYFDMDYSAQALCYGVGGNHYDIGNPEAQISFQPLRNIDTPEERDIAYAFIKVLCELKLPRLDDKRESKLTPEQTSILISTIKSFAIYPKESRTLWEFYNQVNAKDQYLGEAIRFFTKEGQFGLLFDSNNEEYDMLNTPICVYELKALHLKYGNEALIPLLVYLFTNLKFKLFPLRYPLVFIFDEAWMALKNGVFKKVLDNLVRTERKNNVLVILATQQLSDIPSDIFSQCPTRLFLPNPNVLEQYAEYQRLSLNDRQINILASAKPRKQYYYTSPYGRRIFELDICELTKCFTGVNAPFEARDVYNKHGKLFGYYWIKHLSQKYNSSTLAQWAEYWLNNFKKMNNKVEEFNNGEL
ncbi:MAG: helicase HerA domain-containing protein, partial [Burkholderiales bacterium]